jgi:hypothetical protein
VLDAVAGEEDLDDVEWVEEVEEVEEVKKQEQPAEKKQPQEEEEKQEKQELIGKLAQHLPTREPMVLTLSLPCPHFLTFIVLNPLISSLHSLQSPHFLAS